MNLRIFSYKSFKFRHTDCLGVLCKNSWKIVSACKLLINNNNNGNRNGNGNGNKNNNESSKTRAAKFVPLRYTVEPRCVSSNDTFSRLKPIFLVLFFFSHLLSAFSNPRYSCDMPDDGRWYQIITKLFICCSANDVLDNDQDLYFDHLIRTGTQLPWMHQFCIFGRVSRT